MREVVDFFLFCFVYLFTHESPEYACSSSTCVAFCTSTCSSEITSGGFKKFHGYLLLLEEKSDPPAVTSQIVSHGFVPLLGLKSRR